MVARTSGNSNTITFIATAAIAGVGIAYWTSESSASAVRAFAQEILRSAGILRGGKEISAKPRSSSNTTNEKTNNKNVDDWKHAFAAWLEREEKQITFSPLRNDTFLSKEKHLADPKWMSETIRTFLCGLRVRTAVSETRSFVVNEKDSVELHQSSCAETRNSQKTTPSTILSPTKDQEVIENEPTFRRSFRSLQKATEDMIQNEPAIREAFFNGIDVHDELEHSDEETKFEGKRSLSFSSCSSSWSMGSCEVDEENCLVEEEEEVEKLLTYLRFVDLAKESLSESTSPSSPLSSNTNGFLRSGIEPLIPDSGGYEHLHSATMDISVPTMTQTAKVVYTAVVHRNRKELVIAIHYDEQLCSSSTISDRNRIQNILMSSLTLQHQHKSDVSKIAPPSSAFLLLDQAVRSLFEETLKRFWNKNLVKENDSSILNSGYSLVLCGHSLGAALACRLGERFTQRNRDFKSKAIPVRVYAFGPPPCLPSHQKRDKNGNLAEANYSYIISVVNNHDCIPRWTESNLIGLGMSLRWTMDRKQRHFLRYHSRSNQSFSPADSNNAANVTRRQQRQIPPFSVSSMEWNTFWKNSEELNSQGNVKAAKSSYIVPGKVVLIWNHSQDPTIIGAKVHVSETKHICPHSDNSPQLLHRHKESHNNHGVLGRLWVDEGMFSDHTIDSYRSNLELLLAQVGNTI